MVTNAGHGPEAVCGKAMQEIGLQRQWAVAVKDGRIAKVGPEEEVLTYQTTQTEIVDLSGKLLLPGL
jgi:predicted amidohydrolase YtcJ